MDFVTSYSTLDVQATEQALTNSELLEVGWNGRGSVWLSDTQSGEAVSSGSILTSTTCFACTKVLSSVIAGLPGSIMRRVKKKREELDSHRAIDLLCEMPNPEITSYTFFELAATRTVNTGNFWAEIQRDGADKPVGLWPIHPSRVKPVRMPDGSLYWEITGDYTGMPEYQDPSWRLAHDVRLIPARDMLNIVGFGSENGIIGPGLAHSAEEIGVELAARRYGSTIFKNGGVPLGFVEHPTYINDATKRRIFRDDINDIGNRRGKIGVLWEGSKWNSIGITPEQAQCLESRRYTSHQICAIYGVPPPMIGDFRDSKYANAGEAIRQFILITVRNLVEQIERAINTQVMKVRVPGKLISAFNDKTIFRMTLDGLLRGDPKQQAETWKMYRDMGVASANDVLRDLDMNEIDGPEGDYRIVPGGFSRLDNIDNQGNRQAGQPATATPADPAQKAIEQGREFLITSLEEAAHEAKPMVHGSEIVKESIAVVAQSAIERIAEITTTQVERWREKDPKEVEAKLPKFFAQQTERLREALKPADAMAERIGENPISELVVAQYTKLVESLDSFSVFDESRRELKCKFF